MKDKLLTAADILPTLNRALPASEEAESGVLSCLLQDPRYIAANVGTMPPALFAHAGRQEIFVTLVDAACEGRPVDPVSLTHRLRNIGRLENVGGAAYLSELYAYVPLPSHFGHYLGILRNLYSQRRHIEAHAQALDRLFSAQDTSVAGTLDEIKGIMEEAGKMPGQLLKSYSMAECLDSLLSEIEERSMHPGRLAGISTGFPTIDKHTGGMMAGQVWVFAGEPGDGKSTIIQNLAEFSAMAGHKVRWYSLEMTRNEQMLRVVSSAAAVDNGKLYTGALSVGEQQGVKSAAARLKRCSVELVEVEDATATDIFADIERSDCEIVVVDYLQLMEDSSARKSDTREGVLASISRRQKRLARRTGKTILTASQLNDAGKLRESRAIGQDADKVFMLKKFDLEDSETGFDDERRKLWNDKNRGGKRHWELPLRFLGSIFQFREDQYDD